MNVPAPESKRPRLRAGLEGPVLALAVAVALELTEHTPLPVPHPMLLFVLPTVYASYRGGAAMGIWSALIAVAYAVLLYWRQDQGPLPRNGLGLCVEVLTFPLVAVLVGQLHSRSVEQGEAVARRSNAEALESINEELRGEIARRFEFERTLRDREKRIQRQIAELEQLYTWTPVGLGLLDAQLRFVRANESLARIHGLPAQEHIGRTISELTPDFAAAIEPTIRHVLVSGEPVIDMEVEGTLNPAVNTRRSWLVSIHPLQLDDGAVESIILVVVEMTERQQALRALRASEEMYRVLFETAPDAIAVFSADGKIIMANGSAAAMFGWPSAQSMIGRDSQEIIAVEDWARLEANRYLLLRDGSYHNVEYTGVRRDGSRFPFESDAAIIRRADGRPQRLIGIARDISERKKWEEHRQQFVSLVENSGEFIGLATMDRRVFFVNRAGRQLVGLDEANVSRTAIPDYFHAEDRQRQSDLIIEAIRSMGQWRGEVVLRHFENREPIPVDLNAFTVVHPTTGAPLCLAAVARDIRERKANELAVRESSRQLQSLTQQLLLAQEAERRHLARELHDEIGQVLTAISINLQACKALAPNAASNRLDDSIDIVDRAIKQVRNLSLDLRPSMLDDLGLESALRWYANQQAERAGLQVHVLSHLGGERLESALETACFRIVQEALTNVIRHAKAVHSWIEIERGDGELCLSIRDDGQGFETSAMNQKTIEGASAGLLGMRERVKLLGGRMEVHSANARGTMVRVCLPLAAKPENEVEIKNHHELNSRAPGR